MLQARVWSPDKFSLSAAQIEVHAPWGGVVPNLAQEAHKSAIDRTIQEALDQASLTIDQIQAVAVTIGPGLSLCLKVSPLLMV